MTTESKLNIIWQDDYLVVLNKPPYVSVNISETEKETTLIELISEELKIPLERAGVIHRLDKNTSGVLLVAKDQTTLERMQAQFKAREVKKTYLALAHGNIEEADGEINAPISRNPVNREKFGVFEGGRDSLTRFEVKERMKMDMSKIEDMGDGMKKKEREFYMTEALDYTLVTLYPQTGRTHQIRVHLKFIHHPIVGDEVYTGKKLYRMDHRWCPRQFLHAAGITFKHPQSGEEMHFECELADDLKKAMEIFS
jgi:23S rRNA pseudouridine1911/1915/1917 synthase